MRVGAGIILVLTTPGKTHRYTMDCAIAKTMGCMATKGPIMYSLRCVGGVPKPPIQVTTVATCGSLALINDGGDAVVYTVTKEMAGL